jgi:cytoskeletal protein RodZ
MKTVGKQLQEARLAKNWTPELAARETKIKVERVRDLEADDYSHFTSPTYARGFVRTYARSLGLDEYKILRQLDNKLPDDDSANIVTDGGVAYLPETSLPPRAAHRDYTGLYVVMGMGAVVVLAIAFVLLEAYRVGELKRWFGSESEAVATTETTTNSAASAAPPDSEDKRALPVDSNTPPPLEQTNTVATTDGTPRAMPVDPSQLGQAPTPDATSPDQPVKALRALPVNLADLNNAPPDPKPAPVPTSTSVPPRALPVSAADLAADAQSTGTTPPPAAPSTNTPDAAAVATPPPHPASNGPVLEPSPSLPPVEPQAQSDGNGRPLVLTASHDSFVRVTALDTADGDKAVYSAVLHSGQSVAFSGHKFSVNVDNPSAVDIKLDGVNYGPHSDRSVPETFTVVSHVQ